MKKFFKKVKGFFLAVVAGFASLLGFELVDAQQADRDVLSWTHPVQYMDGSALPLADIAMTKVAWGTTPGGPYPNNVDVVGTATTTTIMRGANPEGTRCYRVATVVVTGGQSAYSNERCKTVKTPRAGVLNSVE